MGMKLMMLMLMTLTIVMMQVTYKVAFDSCRSATAESAPEETEWTPIEVKLLVLKFEFA